MRGTSSHHSPGQAVVEFALVLPLLALILLAVVDLGRVFYTYVALANAAREGARYCALYPGDTAGTIARVTSELDGRVAADTSSTICTVTSGGQSPSVTVAVASTFTPVTPLIGSIVGGAITVRAPATMGVW